jgi:predicted Rossmann fold nucleotide-binding protein DprA/Smf involved in DNA uptake
MAGMTQKQMASMGGKARQEQMTMKERSEIGRKRAIKRWGEDKSPVMKLAREAGISRQAAWARLNRAKKKGKTKRKKG